MTRAADLMARLETNLGGNSEKLDDHVIPQTNAEENFSGSEVAPDPVAEVLNSASKTQLRKVPGIGDATARRIIESRPFESEADVMESKVMPETVLKKLKNKLVDEEEGVA